MKRVLTEKLPTLDHPEPLAREEAHHVCRVLRLSTGDELEVLDGKGGHCIATLDRDAHEGWLLRLSKDLGHQTESQNLGLSRRLVLETSILKGDAMEWVVEKAVELGASELVPIQSVHCVVDLQKKGPEFFRDRWQKIADQALKQCGRLHRLKIHLPETLFAGQKRARLWCDEAAVNGGLPLLSQCLQAQKTSSSQDPIHILLGPEGGWSDPERAGLRGDTPQNQAVSLGPLVLRAETASLVAISWFRAFFSV